MHAFESKLYRAFCVLGRFQQISCAEKKNRPERPGFIVPNNTSALALNFCH